ncbi:MAG: hypothetical protein Q7J28_04885 [Caulobacter sp.]|nr:hypothetical protein [Caulobacter sp.]
MFAILFAALLAQEPAPQPIIDGYRWARKPTMADFMRLYPVRALRLGQGANVSMSCKVRPNGALDACAIVDLNGADPAFGPATLALQGLFQLRAPKGEVFPEGGEIRIPIVWRATR